MIRPKFDWPVIEDRGVYGDIKIMTAICTAQMRRFGVSKEVIEKLRSDIRASESYESGCDILRVWFPLTGDFVPKPSRLKDVLYSKEAS